MEYAFKHIEDQIKTYWQQQAIYKVTEDTSKPKYYVLDMFPYPSGAGLHVGHPLGYIASDIFARYKRLKGFNVLHPMGFDAFGLPAEQYALETGQHPAITTQQNIQRYKEQLDKIGFSYDWDRSVITSDPNYYKWTQWIFLQLFHAWFNPQTQKAEPIQTLIDHLAQHGNADIPSPGLPNEVVTPASWASYSEQDKRRVLMGYRLAYLDYAEVWWCEALNTVLANDEVVNGVSERGGYPVEKKKLKQWFLRITAYADRLLNDLQGIEWSEAMVDMQQNWIGKSTGASVSFAVKDQDNNNIDVFTTRPDTIFGVDFLVLAPEHDAVEQLTTAEQKAEVEAYISYVKSRSERERMAEKKISGCFTGSYAINPITKQTVPIWIAEYVLAGYGTGAIMAVPCGDDRDLAFAQHFKIPITNLFGEQFDGTKAVSDKAAVFVSDQSDINGKTYKELAPWVIQQLEAQNKGKAKINYRLRDAGFSRQRYWGEPFPILYDGDTAYAIDELNLPDEFKSLPVTLPHVDHYSAGPNGAGPLANITDWVEVKVGDKIYQRETNTMPGFAGSSWYFLRYTDPHNQNEFVSKAAVQYWQQVDLYIGGTEHAVGHLLYSRMWTKVLFDLGHIPFNEPFNKLVNQGMIGGNSRLVYRIKGTNTFVSHHLKDQYDYDTLHVDVNIVDGLVLDIEAFKSWREDYKTAEFILEEGQYICGSALEKMSKRYYNVVNPDDVVNAYGADTFRMYEMFLGPIEVSKPWDTKGIEGVHRFIKKLWRLFYNTEGTWLVTDETPSAAELKILHKTIQKVESYTERFAMNTVVSQFMIAVNELSAVPCHKAAILKPLLVLLAPYAPFVSEYLYQKFEPGHSILTASFPVFNPAYVVESDKTYPIAINGKTRAEITLPIDTDQKDVEQQVLAMDKVQSYLNGQNPKKIIFVKGKMINIVI